MDTATISDSIINQALKFGLDFDKMHGQGYDRCKTMTRKDNSVQARIRRKHPKETFVHCASHRLNLVVNDLNSVVNVRNTYGTIKAFIKYSRDCPKRRKLISNIPLLSDTRWTSKYKSITFFSEKFPAIFLNLKNLRQAETRNWRKARQPFTYGMQQGMLCL